MDATLPVQNGVPGAAFMEQAFCIDTPETCLTYFLVLFCAESQ